ncbi:penicillin acylase family protein [Hufsiella ginkgonis]|uniref:Penicillin acylase family protein n=1 Tax=Hufsiella ginkgonis TaxID=2695274 RepID=A0A7K1XVV5_9SPHI|nr:penicillin acylase family protein [Hufsiella ginkgonis]MXV15123.1 penicillin acylase family protein [Hufsiella ginkgonis]
MKVFLAVLFTVLGLSLVLLLNMKLGQAPPLGKFLDPFHGFWANAESASPGDKETGLDVPGLTGKVTVVFDDKMIPHIFAGNDHDVYFAQGYITAKDRLWQMDFQTRFASGRLSEVVGNKAVELDRFQRRMGMTYGAEQMIKEVAKYPRLKAVMEAYRDGINAYIHSLKPGDYPIEFKILDYKPEDWQVLNTGLLLKLMSATLAGGSNEFYMSNILAKFGPDITRDLFPDYPGLEDPIIPKGTPWNFKPVSIPQVPKSYSAIATAGIRTKELEEGIGSNNWAISGKKSASGYPILANDPHLDLTLPAIWYQLQLSAPGLNVYGVSIPGSPCVVIGYNKDVAWGVTNVGSDVLDWYQVNFRDTKKDAYFYDNAWKPTRRRIEHIAIRGGKQLDDTVIYTHQGPVVYLDNQKPAFAKAANIPSGHALRWIAHEPSADIWAFYLLNRAKNYDDYRKAITWFAAPAQNFAFASATNDIAITPNGRFPLKWREQGKFLMDGSKPENDWQGWIPTEQNPTVKNPPRGFISSANQSPADQSYPYYLSWEFHSYDRARRINSRLAVMEHATVDSIRALQNDTYSILAENILPVLLKSLEPGRLSGEAKAAYSIMAGWNKQYDAGEKGASIFELWHNTLARMTWDEFLDAEHPMRFPPRERLVRMLRDEPLSPWFDDKNTPAKETSRKIIRKSFAFTIDSLARKLGPIGDKWEWGRVKGSHVPHLAAIPGFGSATLFAGGGKNIVNALSESNGPSWRMIVALGKPNKGYGVFPGGESGNPGSFYYDNMIETWAGGKLNELLFLQSPTETNKRIIKRILLTNH